MGRTGMVVRRAAIAKSAKKEQSAQRERELAIIYHCQLPFARTIHFVFLPNAEEWGNV